MDDIADLMDPGGIAEALSSDIPGLQNSTKSFLQEPEGKPNEVLKMVDSDILDLARQVGDEMEEDSQNASAADLSFLTDAVTKEADGEEDDPALSFLVGGGKMEVTNADLDFLDEEGHLSEAGSSEESDVYEDESEDDREGDDDEEESGSNSSDKDEKDVKKVDTEDQEDGVFGQVSFYDDESTTLEEVKKVKPKKEKKKTKKRKKNQNLDGLDDEADKPVKKKRRKKAKKADSKEDNEEEGDDVINSGTTQMRRKNIR